MTLYVDHDALDGISRSLSTAGAELDGAGASAPTSVDAGLGTPAVLGILAHFAENAGQLVVAVKAAGEAVATANTGYRELDETTAESQNTAVWAG